MQYRINIFSIGAELSLFAASSRLLFGDERLETAAAGILLFPTFSGTPEEAALAFLGGTVARDPNNKCNACGFQSSCSLSGKGGCGRD